VAQVLALSPQQRATFFRYDRSLPLRLEDQGEERSDGVRVRRFRFESIHGERVPATAWIAGDSPGNRPAIILQHGAGSRREADYIRLPALRWARAGFVCVAIDAHLHGQRLQASREPSRVWQLPWTRKEHAVQMAVDLMRLLDLLETRPEIDGARVGYLGFSMGTIMGVPFVGLDPRVKSACFAIGGSLIGEADQTTDPLAPPDAEQVAEIIDPIHFAPLIAPRPTLMINGLQDLTVAPAAADRLFAALHEPKRIEWYVGGHTDLRGAQFRQMFDFFRETL
jgi:cephalosporin-C deacetylase-like acetyl esterase